MAFRDVYLEKGSSRCLVTARPSCVSNERRRREGCRETENDVGRGFGLLCGGRKGRRTEEHLSDGVWVARLQLVVREGEFPGRRARAPDLSSRASTP